MKSEWNLKLGCQVTVGYNDKQPQLAASSRLIETSEDLRSPSPPQTRPDSMCSHLILLLETKLSLFSIWQPSLSCALVYFHAWFTFAGTRLPRSDDRLNLAEFTLICRALFRNDKGHIYDVPHERLEQIFAVFDKNGDGFIDREEFKFCWNQWIKTVSKAFTICMYVYICVCLCICVLKPIIHCYVSTW